jgi:hypothetical protein
MSASNKAKASLKLAKLMVNHHDSQFKKSANSKKVLESLLKALGSASNFAKDTGTAAKNIYGAGKAVGGVGMSAARNFPLLTGIGLGYFGEPVIKGVQDIGTSTLYNRLFPTRVKAV